MNWYYLVSQATCAVRNCVRHLKTPLPTLASNKTFMLAAGDGVSPVGRDFQIYTGRVCRACRSCRGSHVGIIETRHEVAGKFRQFY